MRAQPAHAGELNRVGRLVEGDPAQEEVAVHAEALAGGGEVGADEQEPRGPRGPDQGDVVLADHALGEIADREADLGPAAAAAIRRGPLLPGRAHPLGQLLLHGADMSRNEERLTCAHW